ncbi:hypothetical protein K1718_25880 [Roseibium porphyridii]|uniref:Uncharacterized protein n=1 Tax=Roseibium porphyridii TaxID=2866279 RepID=A0ABY8F2S1_9HYPH|nr:MULTISPECIES: hypothetical protein [Stappiaceae]QFT34571.1 hypothetical protein FIV00_29015 [Labrenzia sp. THAF82]WFE89541.1 hypothetical protein K1718_25880 [Roseibium sp. KMA01]
MITITSPSMCLNDTRSNRIYTMDETKRVSSTDTQRDIVDLVVAAAGRVRGGRIENLVLNAHGSPGTFHIGTGLSSSTMSPWSDVRDKVFKIWFRGCLVARIAGEHTSSHGDGSYLEARGLNSGNGHSFISAFARLTGCYVVAPTEIQSAARQRSSYPRGQLDSYEGLLLSYDPQGRISWQQRYPSLHSYNNETGTVRLPNSE